MQTDGTEHYDEARHNNDDDEAAEDGPELAECAAAVAVHIYQGMQPRLEVGQLYAR